MNLYDTNSFSCPWLLFVRDTLNECGLSYVWQKQDCLGYHKSAMTVMENNYFINYKHFKTNFGTKKYLTYLPN